MIHVELRDVHKFFGGVAAVQGVNIQIRRGELISFLGPSGCGKTTTLNMVAGFLPLDRGSILINGNAVEGLPAYRRNTGMVFQNYALFPHLTVFDNVAFGLRMRCVPKGEIGARVKEALALVRLVGMERRYPKELSGGQQQRVALARAIVIHPEVLLLDEPLSNLDAKLRREMRDEILDIQKRVGITTIFVTHDQEEALAISDRVAVINQGMVEQIGTPREIYDQPRTPFVANFIGESNTIWGTVAQVVADSVWVELPGGGRFQVRRPRARGSPALLHPGTRVAFIVRPERTRVVTSRPEGNSLAGSVVRATYLGATTRYNIRCAGQTFLASAPNGSGNADGDGPTPGDAVFVSWDPDAGTLAPEGDDVP